MNSRIRELIEQSRMQDRGYFIYQYGGLSGHSSVEKTIDLEKFVRLIAKECAVLAMTEHHSTSPAEYEEMEPYEQGCDDTASAISGKIRRIFGVE
jgi:hypothetical protein